MMHHKLSDLQPPPQHVQRSRSVATNCRSVANWLLFFRLPAFPLEPSARFLFLFLRLPVVAACARPAEWQQHWLMVVSSMSSSRGM